mgnify:CR=1 FL=1
MKRQHIAGIYAAPEAFGGQTLTVCGWARTIRDMKNFGFIELNDGSCFKSLQVVLERGKLDNYDDIARQNVGAAFIVHGELVLTPLGKHAIPVLRYRTHDLTRIIPGDCVCGLKHPRIDTLTGRTDDMVKVKGCNMFPAQIEEVIAFTDGASSEYQVMIEAIDGRDVLTVLFETPLEGEDKEKCEQELALLFKAKIGCTPEAKGVPMGELPRSVKKTKRIFDSRY